MVHAATLGSVTARKTSLFSFDRDLRKFVVLHVRKIGALPGRCLGYRDRRSQLMRILRSSAREELFEKRGSKVTYSAQSVKS